MSRWEEIRAYLYALFRDGTTWRGIALLLPSLAGLFGLQLGTDLGDKMAFVGPILSGILAIVWPLRTK